MMEGTLRQSLLVQSFDFGPLLQNARRRRRVTLPLAQALDFPTRTLITNEAASRHTLLEVQTPDRLGLLHDLLRALGGLGVNVVLARVATDRGAAIDSFYLADADGLRITDAGLMKSIQGAVQQAAVNPAG